MTHPAAQSLRVLVSAYACNPDEGSEPQTGWAVACSLALAGHDVVVITRTNNREAIERSLAWSSFRWPGNPPRFEYVDLPDGMIRLKKRLGMLRTYYYLWQAKTVSIARRLVQETGFDAGLHITLGSCWFPSSLAMVPIPYVWGPVGGGEAMPREFLSSLGFRGAIFEVARTLAMVRGRLDPLVRLTARRSKLALGTTSETVDQLGHLGCPRVQLLPRMSLSDTAISKLGSLATPAEEPIRFACIGRLLPWKGFHLAIEAFASADIPGSTLWIVGDGPAASRLRKLSRQLGVEERTRFLGRLSREDTLAALGEVHVLVHPSLHDSGSWVAAEAMAAGRPVICLNLGGPGEIVSEDAGYRVEATTPRDAIVRMAEAMMELAMNPKKRVAMGMAGQTRVSSLFSWNARGRLLAKALESVTGD